MTTKRERELEQEVARLREQVEALDRAVHPPPPEPPPEQPERARGYLIALPMQGSSEVTKDVALRVRGIVERQLPEVEWVIVYRAADMPQDGIGVIMQHVIVAGFGASSAEVRWYPRDGDELLFAPTTQQVKRMEEQLGPLIDALGELIADAERAGPSRLAVGLFALFEVIKANYDLALAKFKAGGLDYAEKAAAALAELPEKRALVEALSR